MAARGFRAVTRFTYGASRGCGGLVNLTEAGQTIASLDVDKIVSKHPTEPSFHCIHPNFNLMSRVLGGIKNNSVLAYLSFYFD